MLFKRFWNRLYWSFTDPNYSERRGGCYHPTIDNLDHNNPPEKDSGSFIPTARQDHYCHTIEGRITILEQKMEVLAAKGKIEPTEPWPRE